MSPLYSNAVFREPRYERREPKPGMRHNTETIYVAHRFPVKDGVDWARSLRNKNVFLEQTPDGMTFRGVPLKVASEA
jgi:hypothetical protein